MGLSPRWVGLLSLRAPQVAGPWGGEARAANWALLGLSSPVPSRATARPAPTRKLGTRWFWNLSSPCSEGWGALPSRARAPSGRTKRRRRRGRGWGEMSGGRRRGLVWSLPVARSDALGKLGPAFGIGAGCGVGIGFGLVGGAYPSDFANVYASCFECRSRRRVHGAPYQTGELECSRWFWRLSLGPLFPGLDCLIREPCIFGSLLELQSLEIWNYCDILSLFTSLVYMEWDSGGSWFLFRISLANPNE